ncbi:MAG: hypothetical protein U1E20_01050 [Methylocystis sp.]|uniref:hypothetical protein n=1 Tax=Methylocystis sp. TaxID=1911079 RepID=UPI003931DF3B
MTAIENSRASLRTKRSNSERLSDSWIDLSLALLAVMDGRSILFLPEQLACHSRRAKRDRESRAKPALLDRRWIPGQAFGLPGMTGPANGSTGIRSS